METQLLSHIIAIRGRLTWYLVSFDTKYAELVFNNGFINYCLQIN